MYNNASPLGPIRITINYNRNLETALVLTDGRSFV